MDISVWKKRKKELGWTHDDLARESGISRRTIAGIFSGDPRYSSPTMNTVEAIERALGIRPNELEWSDEERAAGVGNHPTFLSDEERDWLELGSEVIRIRGKQYYEALKELIKMILKNPKF